MIPAPPETVTPGLRAVILQRGLLAGHLESLGGGAWRFVYEPGYAGPPVSLGLPVRAEHYAFATFPPFLDGLLPEGAQLEALLRRRKIDRRDVYRQLIAVGRDLVGSLQVLEEGEG